MPFERSENYEEQKRQAEEMLKPALDRLYELDLRIAEGPVQNELKQRDIFEKWFDDFVAKVKERFPHLEVVLTEDVDDALSDARQAYQVSGGAGTAEYTVNSVVREIIEIRTPEEQRQAASGDQS